MLPKQSLLIGIGNPGKTYENTRHNIGQWWIDCLAKKLNLQFKPNTKLHAEIASNSLVRIAKTTTYMNHSGIAVAALANYYQIQAESIIIIHDEIDLPAGSIKLKSGGGLGGHNGLKSIKQHLANENFNRIRIGINHPGNKSKVSNFVLSKPSLEELIEINKIIEISTNNIDFILAGNFSQAMQQIKNQE